MDLAVAGVISAEEVGWNRLRRLWLLPVMLCCSCSIESGSVVANPVSAPSPSWAPVVSPEVVSAACGFLGADELQRALESKAAYRSVEEKPVEGQRSVAYGCEFSRVDDGSGVGSLMVTAIKGEAAPESALAVAEQNCLGEGQAQPLAGAGEVAMWCRSEELDTLVVTVKRSHGEVRIAHLTLAGSPMAANIPGYGSLARLLGGRL
ncbi:hypothetical protein [Amycolatopsis keratiniphila]|uniref:hypothetical protein n=1 Tax=Amycolatopsis keratiniphila TaxID=129921 RepID=UPI00117CE305|nr:hypothetical protein [Amycolatopsis keratiniphila]